MNRTVRSLIVLGVLILATACASGDLVAPGEDTTLQGGEAGREEIQLQHEGIGPLEITPDPGSRDESTSSAADQGGGNISPSGAGAQSETISEGSGQIDSFAPGELVADQGDIAPEDWFTYQDQDFNFSIDYPDTYIILPEDLGAEDTGPTLIHRVRFQDMSLASGDTANLEIPKFNIEVFEQGDQTLDEFIDNHASGAEREEFTLGNLIGFRVYFNRLSAPNEFYYFSKHGYVYKLTPLGKYSKEMLHSFAMSP